MTKTEALQLVKQAVSVYRGTLQEHQVLQEAIKTLEEDNAKNKNTKK